MSFISTPLIVGGIQSPSSVASGSAYAVTSSVSESVYPYDASKQRLVGDYTGSVQRNLILWSNDAGVDGDGRLYLSELSSSFTPTSSITFFYLNSLDNQLPVSSTTYAPNSSVFDISDSIYTDDCYYQYNKLKWILYPGTSSIDINGVNLITTASFSGSMIFTIPGTGSYAYSIYSMSYASNTSSIFFFEAAGKLVLNGVTDFNEGSLSGDYFNGHVLLLQSAFGPSGLDSLGLLIKNPLTINSYFYKTGSSGRFEIQGNVTSSFKPGTIVEIAGYELLVDGTTYDTESSTFLTGVYPTGGPPSFRTWIYTIGYPDPDIYYPVSASFGTTVGYALGFNSISSNKSQLVAGMYNRSNNQDKLLVIGNGYSDSIRKDALAVNVQGVTILGSTSTPTAVEGGIYYDGINFYLGF